MFTIWTSLGAGIASFISPCVLPLVPVYLRRWQGLKSWMKGGPARRLPSSCTRCSSCSDLRLCSPCWERWRARQQSASTQAPPDPLDFGRAARLLRTLMLASQFIPALGFEKRLTPKEDHTTSYLRSFIVGGAFTVAWTPCLSPILGSVFTTGGTSRRPGGAPFCWWSIPWAGHSLSSYPAPSSGSLVRCCASSAGSAA